MYHYNLIQFEDKEDFEECGLSIMLTDHYQKLIFENPGIMHHNFGDVYSHLSSDEISDKICEDFEEYAQKCKLNSAVIVSELKVGEYDESKNYIVREPYGARVVLPEIYNNPHYDPDFPSDSFMVEYLVESIIDDWTRGSIAKVYEDMDEMAQDIQKRQNITPAPLTLDDTEDSEITN